MVKLWGFLRGPDEETLRWNFTANVLDGALFALAMSFVSLQTVLPVVVKKMGGSNVAIGLIPVIWTFGFNVPQILITRKLQRLSRKKKLFLRTAFVQRIPWLLLGAVVLIVDDLGTTLGLVLFFTLFSVAAVAGSINLPVWFDLIAKLTPVNSRGRLMALRGILGAVLGIFGGGAVAYILSTFAYPGGYAILFVLAFLFMMISYLFLLSLRENWETETLATNREWHLIPLVREIFKSRVNFRNFLIADALLIGSTMANGFFAVHALERFALSDEYTGAFTITMMLSMILSSLVFGYLADYYGHKLNLLISAATTVAACLTALVASSVEVYLLVFACSASTLALASISRLPIIAELSSESERGTYVAVTNLLTAPFVLFGLLAGWIADSFGYDAVFVIAGLFSVGAFVWLKGKVTEPRNNLAAV